LFRFAISNAFRRKGIAIFAILGTALGIAHALILNPSVILGDEPTGNLDTKTGAEIIELMRKLNEQGGKTFIIVTHDSRIAESAERVLYLVDGRLADVPIEE